MNTSRGSNATWGHLDEQGRSMSVRSRRVAVVTGGGSGIGEATCRHLAAAGHRVAALDLDGDAAGRVAEQLLGEGHHAIGLRADVTDRVAVDEAFAKVRADMGPTDILVTSAGMVAFDDFLDITPERWAKVVDVNLTGTFHCC